MRENCEAVNFFDTATATPIVNWQWYLRNIVLNDCLHSHPSDILASILNKFDVALTADSRGFYFLLTGLKKRVYHSVYRIDAIGYMRMYYEMEAGLRRILEENDCIGDFFMVFEEDCKQIALIFSPSQKCAPEALAQQVCQYVQHYYEEHLFFGDSRYCNFAALSDKQQGLPGIRKGYLDTRDLCDLDFFMMEPRAITRRDVEQLKNDLDYRGTIELCLELDSYLVAGDGERAEKCLDRLFLDRLKYAFSVPLCRDALSFIYYKLDLHLTVYDLIQEYPPEKLCSLDSYITIGECRDALLEPIIALCRQVKAQGSRQSVVQQAMYYIKHYYAKPITLPLIAESAGVTPNYCPAFLQRRQTSPFGTMSRMFVWRRPKSCCLKPICGPIRWQKRSALRTPNISAGFSDSIRG